MGKYPKNREEIRLSYCLAVKNREEIRRRVGNKFGVLAKIFTLSILFGFFSYRSDHRFNKRQNIRYVRRRRRCHGICDVFTPCRRHLHVRITVKYVGCRIQVFRHNRSVCGQWAVLSDHVVGRRTSFLFLMEVSVVLLRKLGAL